MASIVDENYDLNKDLYGEAAASRMRAFAIGIQAIEDKHRAFFAETVSKFSIGKEKEPAPIGEFYALSYTADNAQIGFNPALPSDIVEEIRECFKKSFS